MKQFKSAIQAFIADEDGVTAIEYSLIAALVGVAMATGAQLLGTSISDAFSNIAARLTSALN